MKSTITKDILKVAKFAEVKGLRPVLGAVRISNNRMVATDSYKIIEAKYTNEFRTDFPVVANCQLVESLASPVLIPAKDILKKLKFPTNPVLPVLGTAALCNETEHTVSLATTDLETATTLQFKKVDGEYPQFDIIWPKEEQIAETVVVDAKLMIEVLQGLLTDGKTSRVRIHLQNEGTNKAVLVTGEQEDNKHIRALCMPCKDSRPPKQEEQEVKQVEQDGEENHNTATT